MKTKLILLVAWISGLLLVSCGAPKYITVKEVEHIKDTVLIKADTVKVEIPKEVIVNVVPQYLIDKYDLLDKKEAIEQIHFPDSMEKLEHARFTLVFEEFFLIQLIIPLQLKLISCQLMGLKIFQK